MGGKRPWLRALAAQVYIHHVGLLLDASQPIQQALETGAAFPLMQALLSCAPWGQVRKCRGARRRGKGRLPSL